MTTSSDSTKPHYVPTPDDLNDAILAVLDENESPLQPSAKQVKTILESQNPTWELPERRVAKFLKKQRKVKRSTEKMETNAPTHDEISTGSATSRTKQLLHSTGAAIKSTKKSVRNIFSSSHKENESSSSKKGFSFRKKKRRDEDAEVQTENSTSGSATAPEITTKLLPELSVEETEENDSEPVTNKSPDKSSAQTEKVKEAKVTAKGESAVGSDLGVKERAVAYDDDNTGKVEECDVCSGCVIL